MLTRQELYDTVTAKSNIKNALFGNPEAPRPIHMQIEPTNRCNFRCVMCAREDIRKSIKTCDMSFESYVKTVDQMSKVRSLMLSGFGEPLLNPELIKMIKYSKSKGTVVEITTNLSLIDKEKAKEIVKSGLDNAFTSIHSANRHVYRKVTGSTLSTSLRGLENLINAKKEALSDAPKITINTVILNLNLDRIEEVVKLAGKYKVNVNLKSQTTFGYETGQKFKTAYPAEKLDRFIKLGRELGIKVGTSIKSPHTKDFRCYRIWFGGFISCDGTLYPCCEFYNAPKMGNVLKEGFEKCWNSSEFIEFRRNHAKGELESYSAYIRRTCIDCNLKFNDRFGIAGKYIRKFNHFFAKVR